MLSAVLTNPAIEALIEGAPTLGWGLLTSILLSIQTLVLSLLIGALGAAMRDSGSRLMRRAVTVFVEAFRNTPFLVQLYFAFFVLPYLGVRFDPMNTAIIALSLNSGAYTVEIIRGGFHAVGNGQFEAGRSLGLTKLQVLRLVALRPAFRAAYPGLTAQFVLIFLTSSIASSISVPELTYSAQIIDSQTFRTFEVYGSAAALYLATSTLIRYISMRAYSRFVDYPSH